MRRHARIAPLEGGFGPPHGRIAGDLGGGIGDGMGGSWWWIVADFHGRNVVLGPHSSQQAANEVGYGKLDCPFRVVSLPTRDKGRAISMLKAQRLQRTGDLGQALDKMGHKIPKNEG